MIDYILDLLELWFLSGYLNFFIWYFIGCFIVLLGLVLFSAYQKTPFILSDWVVLIALSFIGVFIGAVILGGYIGYYFFFYIAKWVCKILGVKFVA